MKEQNEKPAEDNMTRGAKISQAIVRNLRSHQAQITDGEPRWLKVVVSEKRIEFEGYKCRTGAALGEIQGLVGRTWDPRREIPVMINEEDFARVEVHQLPWFDVAAAPNSTT